MEKFLLPAYFSIKSILYKERKGDFMENLLIHVLITTLLILLLPQSAYGLSNKDEGSRIHYNSIVVDGHNDTMMKVVDKESWLPKINIGQDTNFHIDMAKLKKGGLNVPFFAAYTHGYYNNQPKSLSRTLALINALHWTEKNNRDVFEIAPSVGKIREASSEGKIAGVASIEGAYSITEANYKELLKQYYDLGIRVLGYTWNYSNDLGEGASGIYGDPEKTPSPKGLTKLGKRLVSEMNRLGMVIDVSHMSERSFWDVINLSKDPVIASHSGVYRLKEHPRNLRDDQLKALAKNGGVVGIVLYPEFLADHKEVYIKDYVDHIDYVVNLIGIDHVGIGSDFDGASMPKDLKDSSEIYKISQELINRGYKKEDIEKILGKNMIRVLEEVLADSTNIKEKGENIYIIPQYKMGEKTTSFTPILQAKIESSNGLDISSFEHRIILNGISYQAQYNKDTSTLYFKVKEALKEKFHVVTFEISNKQGRVERQTRIFYIDN